jgi:hypothetical protein
MNRDGQGGEPPSEDTSVDVPDGEATPDNVIAFPRTRPTLRAAADDVVEPERSAAAEAEPSMSMDEFERAVRAAVAEKVGPLGDLPGATPRGADELVAQVFSALSGKDPKAALAEVRARLSGEIPPEPPRPEATVIDLASVRESRQKANLEAASKLGGALKDSFAQFLANLAQRPGQSGDIVIDGPFLKQHGPALLGNLFQGLASALTQQVKPTSPVEAPPEAGAPEPPAEPTEPAQPAEVHVRFDFGSLLAGLFRRPAPRPPEKPPETP